MPERAGRPFLILTVAFFTLLLGSNLPTPLYAVYRERFGFSSAVLTLVFATYMIVLVPTLLLCGQLSDRVGRKRVIAAGLLTAAVGLGLFAAATATAWLFAARAVQGLSVGMVTGAATAGLVELEPHGDRERAALYAVIVQGAGSSAGPLLAGVLAQWAPAPRVLCYLVALVLALLAAVAVLTIPEPKPAGGRWRVQRPSVPPEIRAGFWRASLTAGTVWMVAALYLSVVPSYAAKLLDTGNLALLGAIAGSLLAASCAAQLIASRRDRAAGAQPLGLALVVAGLAALVLAFPLHFARGALRQRAARRRRPRPRLPRRAGRDQRAGADRAPRRGDRRLHLLHLLRRRGLGHRGRPALHGAVAARSSDDLRGRGRRHRADGDGLARQHADQGSAAAR